jgi:hypothetical protein
MLGDIIDSITGLRNRRFRSLRESVGRPSPSPEEHLAIENAEYDGETIEELLPPRSKGGVHMSYSPSREHLRQIAEQHGPEQMFGMEYQIGQCGTWQFVKEDDGEVVEQCDNCGEYRRRDTDVMDEG